MLPQAINVHHIILPYTQMGTQQKRQNFTCFLLAGKCWSWGNWAV